MPATLDWKDCLDRLVVVVLVARGFPGLKGYQDCLAGWGWGFWIRWNIGIAWWQQFFLRRRLWIRGTVKATVLGGSSSCWNGLSGLNGLLGLFGGNRFLWLGLSGLRGVFMIKIVH